MNELLKNHHDFLILYLLNKDEGEFITTLMKNFQIFTSFEKFKHLNHFKANYYGGEDTILETAIYSASELFPIEFIGEDDKQKKIHLNQEVKQKIMKNLPNLLENPIVQQDYNLIVALSKETEIFQQRFIIKFCYYFFPEMAKRSVIAANIAKIREIHVSNVLVHLINHFPVVYSIEFLESNLDKILDLVMLSEENIENLKNLTLSLFQYSNTSDIIIECKDSVLNLIENVSDIQYKQILRKSLNVLIFNENIEIRKTFLVKWLIFILKLKPEYTQNDYNALIDLFNQENLHFSLNTIQID